MDEELKDKVYDCLLKLNAAKSQSDLVVKALSVGDLNSMIGGPDRWPALEIRTCLKCLVEEGLVCGIGLHSGIPRYFALTPVEIVQAKRNKPRSLKKKRVEPSSKALI